MENWFRNVYITISLVKDVNNRATLIYDKIKKRADREVSCKALAKKWLNEKEA